jgi:hypothetical protein
MTVGKGPLALGTEVSELFEEEDAIASSSSIEQRRNAIESRAKTSLMFRETTERGAGRIGRGNVVDVEIIGSSVEH